MTTFYSSFITSVRKEMRKIALAIKGMSHVPKVVDRVVF